MCSPRRALSPQVNPDTGLPPPCPDTARFLELQPVATSPFFITAGPPHRVTFVDTAVTILRDDGISCMQVFSLGEATVSAVVRDAQGSPVTTYALPIDLRLCDPPLQPGGPHRCPAVHARLVGDVQALPVAGIVTFNNFSVTNISSGVGYVLQLFTPLLQVDYSLPFRACDAGVPQELFFAVEPSFETIATSPLARQPIVLVRDGFGALVKYLPNEMEVQLRAVPVELGAGPTDIPNVADVSVSAQLRGTLRVPTTFSDPLGLDDWNTTTYHAQHAIFTNVALGTAGRWRLHASSAALSRAVVSEIVSVLPGDAAMLRFAPVDDDITGRPLTGGVLVPAGAPYQMLTRVGDPLQPMLVVTLYDLLGNNVTNENATAEVPSRPRARAPACKCSPQRLALPHRCTSFSSPRPAIMAARSWATRAQSRATASLSSTM